MSEQNRRAFLKLIRVCEGTDGADGYRLLNGGEKFTDFRSHPNRRGKGGTSTAAGAYQFIYSTWLALQLKLKLPDFTPPYQDIAAIEKLRERGALKHIDTGNIEAAISRLKTEWVSLPGAADQQRTLAQAKNIYSSNGGFIA